MTFSETGGLITVPAGAGYLGTQPTILVSRAAPSGVEVFILNCLCAALDIDLTQISFSFRRNGSSLLSGLAFIPAAMFQANTPLRVDEMMPTGTFDIVAYNLSGTGLPNAMAAVSPLCQASWNGSLNVIHRPFTIGANLFPRSPNMRRGFLK